MKDARTKSETPPSGAVATLALGGILILAIILNFANLGFPLGYHADEPKKVRFVLLGIQDFKHPLLLLDLTRLVRAFTGTTDPQEVVELGRFVSAAAGVLSVALLYVIARRTLQRGPALLAALFFATSPIQVVHAHYMKEDAVFVAMMLLSLWTYLRFLDEPRLTAALLFGSALGGALAAQYKALLLIPIFFGCVSFLPRTRWRVAFPLLLAATGTAALVYLALNYPVLTDPAAFRAGLRFELTHARIGHDVVVPPLSHFFAFHVLHSLMPGLTPLTAAASLAAFVFFAFRWRSLERDGRVLLVTIAVLHAAIELSPLKPFPDFMRYALPEVPLLFYFLARAAAGIPHGTAVTMWIRRGALVALWLVPLWASAQLVWHFSRDTRAVAERWAAGRRGVEASAYATSENPAIGRGPDVDALRARGIRYVMVSSFVYDRLALARRLEEAQSKTVLARAARYEALFRHPWIEIEPEFRSFAFSNPTIRIVDIGAAARH